MVVNSVNRKEMRYVLIMNRKLNKGLVLIVLTGVIYVLFCLPLYQFKLMDIINSGLLTNPLTFLSILLMILLYIPIKCLVKDYISAVSIYSLLYIIIVIVNGLKIRILREPLYPSDFGMVTNIVGFMSMISIGLNVLLISSFSILFIIFAIFLLKRQKYSKKLVLKDYASFVIVFGLLFLIPKLAPLKNSDNLFYKFSSNIGFTTVRWDQFENYRKNGPIFGFIYNFKDKIMDKPMNYSKSVIAEIESKYNNLAINVNLFRQYDDFSDINVIYVLSESFSNPNRISGIKVNPNPAEYISDRSDKNLVSSLITPSYGSGTSGVEFEVLTGMSTDLFNTGNQLPYQDFLPTFDNFPSIVSRYKQGTGSCETTTIHSYNSSFYKRKANYNVLGFDSALFEDDMNGFNEKLNDRYIKDSELYNFTLDQMLMNSGTSFYQLISMQNHTGYPDVFNEYNYSVSLENGSEQLEKVIKIYSEGLGITDDATKIFINSLKDSDNKTVVVFYGDHLPGIYNELRSIDNANNLEFYTTDFFIYSNFNEIKLNDEHVSTIGIEALVNKVSDVKVSPFIALIDEMNSRFIYLGEDSFLLTDNSVVNFEQLQQRDQQLFRDYQIVIYDVVSKSNNLSDSFWE